MPRLDTLGPGAQVVYLPIHSGGNIWDDDNEAGFIIKVDAEKERALCGFYSNAPGPHSGDGPLAAANGEWCSFDNLVALASRPQFIVDNDLARIQRAMEWAHE